MRRPAQNSLSHFQCRECEISTVSVPDWDPLALGDDVAAAATGLKPAFLLVCLTMCDFRKENVLATHCCLSVSSAGPWPDRERVSLPYMVLCDCTHFFTSSGFRFLVAENSAHSTSFFCVSLIKRVPLVVQPFVVFEEVDNGLFIFVAEQYRPRLPPL